MMKVNEESFDYSRQIPKKYTVFDGVFIACYCQGYK
jgi:hypothetical protein